jgi:hypothetical protein
MTTRDVSAMPGAEPPQPGLDNSGAWVMGNTDLEKKKMTEAVRK